MSSALYAIATLGMFWCLEGVKRQAGPEEPGRSKVRRHGTLRRVETRRCRHGHGDNHGRGRLATCGQGLMAGLVLKLRAHEEVLINGVVMRNGERNVRLVVKSPDANILRLSEALQPEEAATPVSRLCYLAQQVVAGEREGDETRPELLRGLNDLNVALDGHPAASHLADAGAALEEGKFYGAFRALKRMIPVEADLMQRGA